MATVLGVFLLALGAVLALALGESSSRVDLFLVGCGAMTFGAALVVMTMLRAARHQPFRG